MLLVSLALAAGVRAQNLCSVRNGSGANPVGFACTSEPLIGATWNTSVDIVTPGAQASAVVVFLGGPLPGVPLNFGELLCNPPTHTIDIATGAHAIPIPNLAHLVGNSYCAQAATIKFAPLRLQLQNALDLTIGVTGTEDISVLVLRDTGSGPASPQSGARVTLQGRDPASFVGLAKTTGASGQVTFQNVAGPYSVTAQVDIPNNGIVSRLASSVIDVIPTLSGSAGTIGIVLLDDFETNAPVNATLSGTVTNMPTLSGNEFLQVTAVRNGSEDFEGYAFVDPSTGAYSMSIPSGVRIDCYVAHRKDFSQPSSAVLASLLSPNVGQTGAGTTLTANFDFGSAAVVPWTRTVSFSATNRHPAMDLSIQLLVEDPANGVAYDFSFFDGMFSPTSITLPDVTNAAFAGYRTTLDMDAFDPTGRIEGGQDCSQVLTTTPASASFNLFSLPALLQPVNHATLTLPQLDALTVQIQEAPTGSFGNNGVNLFALENEVGLGGPPPPGIDQAVWYVFARAGDASFDLPPYDLPMFAVNQPLFGSLEQPRFQGFTFTYDTFFGPGLAGSLAALLNAPGSCSSEAVFDLFVVP